MIGLLGGSFDPIHEGHTELALKLLNEYPFKKILFIPNAQNPLKTAKPTGEALRFEMVRRALEELNNPRLEVSRVEIDRPAPSYMFDTVTELKKTTRENLVLIVGNEVFKDIEHWKEPAKLLQAVDVIVVKRDPHSHVNVEGLLRKLHIVDGVKNTDFRITHSSNSRWIEEKVIPVLDLSSTEIRAKLKEAWKQDELQAPLPGLQRSVCLLIKENKLYAR